MFGTIIMDAYKADEAEVMANYIDEICSPMDNWCWASAGIYSFWDYYTKEILYIGLASDLCVRFKQHNGLYPIDENACKVRQIREYFSGHEKLGYSILVQSPLSQPIVHRNESLYRKFLDIPRENPIPNYAGEEGLEHIRKAEGQLIESYRRVRGNVPPWNKIGGDVEARKSASTDNYLYVVQAFSQGAMSNYLMSKSTIRELADNATYAWFESQLHGLRMMMLTMGMSFEQAVTWQLKMNPYFQDQWNRIMDSRYLEKQIDI